MRTFGKVVEAKKEIEIAAGLTRAEIHQVLDNQVVEAGPTQYFPFYVRVRYYTGVRKVRFDPQENALSILLSVAEVDQLLAGRMLLATCYRNDHGEDELIQVTLFPDDTD